MPLISKDRESVYHGLGLSEVPGVGVGMMVMGGERSRKLVRSCSKFEKTECWGELWGKKGKSGVGAWVTVAVAGALVFFVGVE